MICHVLQLGSSLHILWLCFFNMLHSLIFSCEASSILLDSLLRDSLLFFDFAMKDIFRLLSWILSGYFSVVTLVLIVGKMVPNFNFFYPCSLQMEFLAIKFIGKFFKSSRSQIISTWLLFAGLVSRSILIDLGLFYRLFHKMGLYKVYILVKSLFFQINYLLMLKWMVINHFTAP